MSGDNEVREWVSYAEEDFITAKEMLKRRKPLLLTVCFHSQQCAEKYLKAMLVFKDVSFPKTHDLLILDMLCNDAGIATGFSKEQLVDLSGHAVHTRYPGNAPTLEDAKDAVAIATVVRRFTLSFLGLKK
ncbi:MAG: HEPN domain-containing protein [Chloroflexota bacterium]